MASPLFGGKTMSLIPTLLSLSLLLPAADTLGPENTPVIQRLWETAQEEPPRLPDIIKVAEVPLSLRVDRLTPKDSLRVLLDGRAIDFRTDFEKPEATNPIVRLGAIEPGKHTVQVFYFRE